jgi:16S rRNA G527 N7-methylase RsmG
MVEATRKKTAFLEEVIRALALTRSTAYWSRIETPSPELRDAAPFDVALARAVGDVERLRGAVAALLRPRGEFWSFTSPASAGAAPWPTDEDPRTALLRIS